VVVPSSLSLSSPLPPPSQQIPFNGSVVANELFGNTVARLYEFPDWEELKIFDSDDLWEEKCFALIPSSFTTFLEKKDEALPLQPSQPSQGLTHKELPMVSEVEIYVWIGSMFNYMNEVGNVEEIEKENYGENVIYHFPTHDNEVPVSTQDMSILHKWIKSVCHPLIMKVIKEKREIKKKLRVVVYVEKEGEESEEFWGFFENG
jgi:hypothetical protein